MFYGHVDADIVWDLTLCQCLRRRWMEILVILIAGTSVLRGDAHDCRRASLPPFPLGLGILMRMIAGTSVLSGDCS